jgi:hypothetical protein
MRSSPWWPLDSFCWECHHSLAVTNPCSFKRPVTLPFLPYLELEAGGGIPELNPLLVAQVPLHDPHNSVDNPSYSAPTLEVLDCDLRNCTRCQL